MAPDATATWARLGMTPTSTQDWAAAVLASALAAIRTPDEPVLSR